MSAMLFLMAVLAGLFFVPALAALVRSQVPVRPSASLVVQAITFGTSQKARPLPASRCPLASRLDGLLHHGARRAIDRPRRGLAFLPR